MNLPKFHQYRKKGENNLEMVTCNSHCHKLDDDDDKNNISLCLSLHSFHKNTVSTFCVLSTALSAGDTEVGKIYTNPCLHGAHRPVGEQP